MLPLNKIIGAGGQVLIDDAAIHSGFYYAIDIREDSEIDVLTNVDGDMMSEYNVTSKTLIQGDLIFAKADKPFLTFSLASGSVWAHKEK